jgi:hypothetical protein
MGEKDTNRRPGKTVVELRKFGFVMTVPFAVIGGVLFWFQRPAWPYVVGIALFFLLSAFVVPRILGPVERIWMAFAAKLSIVSTFIILNLAFFLVITPIGLIMRLVKKDPMHLKQNPDLNTYWIPTEPDGPATRPEKPY